MRKFYNFKNINNIIYHGSCFCIPKNRIYIPKMTDLWLRTLMYLVKSTVYTLPAIAL